MLAVASLVQHDCRALTFSPSLAHALCLRRSYASARPPRPFLCRYKAVPVDLARVQSGVNVRLRDYNLQRARNRFTFDLRLKDGLVYPVEGDTYDGPNGCPLRLPSSPMFQKVVRTFKWPNTTIYILKQGTCLPESLVLLHEPCDDYSLQCTYPMSLNEFNTELTEFINEHGQKLDREAFEELYPITF